MAVHLVTRLVVWFLGTERWKADLLRGALLVPEHAPDDHLGPEELEAALPQGQLEQVHRHAGQDAVLLHGERCSLQQL